MKYLVSAVFVLVLSSLSIPAMASGCGGPEYYLQSTKVLSTSPFKERVENNEIYLTFNSKGPYLVKLALFTKLISVQGVNFFFWHDLTLQGTIPADITVEKLDAALKSTDTVIDLVEDTYDINCGTPSGGVEKNLRIQMKYGSKVLEFKTNYFPAATSDY